MIEFFAGMGGWRQAFAGAVQVAAAYDISPHAIATYEAIHGERPIPRELATLPLRDLPPAEAWVMSPPCQPFCRMGNRQDLEDPRSRAFLHLMDLFAAAPPEHLALESVEGFLGSQAHALLASRLREAGFQWLEYSLCPSRFGIPNLRPRAYIVASRWALSPPARLDATPATLAAYLDPEEDPSLYVPEAILARHRPGLDLVRPESTRTACFIGGYGQRYVGSGSFLVTPRGIRRFSVAEEARLLGWPGDFAFPATVGREARYKLLGNGLSIPVASWIAGHFI